MNTLDNIKTYSMAELHAVAAEDRHAVRDEALRRQESELRKLNNAKRKLEALGELLKVVL